MVSITHSANHFLGSLSAQDRELITPHLHPMELPHEAVFYKAEDMISQLYFPEGGVVSLVVGFANGQFVESGMFGRNGVIGVGAALDGDVALNQATSHVAGAGFAADVNAIRRLVSESPSLRTALA